ncbi:MAG: VWA domain-containing protein [Bacteroidales bacterium]|nr:VWA domain-containing protein [Bacteroidales bacterium]
MIRFEHPGFIYALLVIPLLIVIFLLVLRWKKKVMERFGHYQVIRRLMPDISGSKVITRFILFLIAYVFLIFGIANPQVGSKLVEAERRGIDLVIALDVSNSMLAEDIQPNRLVRSRQAIMRLLDMLGNDRIGIVVFAGKAYVQLPITTDFAAAKMFLSTVGTDAVPVQGTAIGEAIRQATKSFDDDTHTRAIIIITDGENHEDDAVDAAMAASENGIMVFTIGMGLPEGAPIPVLDQYNRPAGYKKGPDGSTIVTRLNETMLQQIASAGKGAYVRASNSDTGLKKIFGEIDKLEKTKFDSRVFSDYEDRFQYFIGSALVLLVLEMLIYNRRNRFISRINLFGEEKS